MKHVEGHTWAWFIGAVFPPLILGALSWRFRHWLAWFLTIDQRKAARHLEGITRYLRDISINVIANLVSVAILYLLATFAGVLPRHKELVTGSVAILLFFAIIIVGVATKFASPRLFPPLGGGMFILLGIFSAFGGFFFEDSGWRSFFGSFIAWTLFAMSIFFFRINKILNINSDD